MANISLPSEGAFIHSQSQLTDFLAQGSEHLTHKLSSLAQKISSLLVTIFPSFCAIALRPLVVIASICSTTAKQPPAQLPSPRTIKAAVIRAKPSRYRTPQPTPAQLQKLFLSEQKKIQDKEFLLPGSFEGDSPLNARREYLMQKRKQENTKIGGTDKDTQDPAFKSGTLNKKQFRNKISFIKHVNGQHQSPGKQRTPWGRSTTAKVRKRVERHVKRDPSRYTKLFPLTFQRLKEQQNT